MLDYDYFICDKCEQSHPVDMPSCEDAQALRSANGRLLLSLPREVMDIVIGGMVMSALRDAAPPPNRTTGTDGI